MSSDMISFNKENLDLYLRELAKEFRKLNGKTMPAEIILIGGASVLANYGFRDMTYDMDAVIVASSAMKEAINRTGDKYGLPTGWLNTDFVKTKSYSPKLIENSVYYKTFSNILTVRTVSGEYLIAMKLLSGRKYKNDLSDVVGILMSHEEKGDPITLERIKNAVVTLYGALDALSDDSVHFIETMLENTNYEETYRSIRAEEAKNKDILLEFEQEYPGVTNERNIDDILKAAEKKLTELPADTIDIVDYQRDLLPSDEEDLEP